MTAEPETLVSRLCAVAARHAQSAAVIAGGRVYTYRQLLGSVEGLADRLARTGVGRGDRVALVCPNSIEFVVGFFASAWRGGIAVPLNPSLQASDMAAVMQGAAVSVVLTMGPHEDRCRLALGSARGPDGGATILLDAHATSSPGGGGRRPVTHGPRESPAEDDPAVSLCSSGSTGRPKPVERSHRNLVYETDRLIRALGLSPRDRVLGVAPFSHVNGLMRSMMASLLSGATLVPLTQFERRAVGRAIEEHRITVFIGVPFMFGLLADTRWPEAVDFSSLRLCISASAPLRPETSRRFQERYGLYVRQLYGTTETGTISVNLAPRVEDSLESVGAPLQGVTVEVFSEDGRPQPAGTIGEIGIRSAAAAREYRASPGETARAFRGGYFFPGDLGRKDAAGRLYLAGRTSIFINRAGYKVNPYEVEEVLARHPKVREVAVTGAPGEYGDQKVKAVVVAAEPCGAREIVEFCRGRLADFKVPSVVEFRADLPKSATGKILRSAL